MNKTVYKNIFKEYKIKRDVSKKHKRPSRKVKSRKTTYRYDEDYSIENDSSGEENLSRSFRSVQMKRSFEIPLKMVSTPRNGNLNNSARDNLSFEKRLSNRKNNEKIYDDDESDDSEDMMPRPIKIKEEPMEEQSEEIHLSWRSSTISSIVPSAASNEKERISNLQSALNSSIRNTRLRKNLSMSFNSPSLTPELNTSLNCSPSTKRYQPLEISIIRKTTPRRSPRIAAKKKNALASPKCRKNLNTSWPSSDEEPFQTHSPLSGEKSFQCSSPKPSQVIDTPSSTASPRKMPISPQEMDLMHKLIEKENAEKSSKAQKYSRKSSKRCLPGGYAEMYERSMAKARTDGRFLKHDKKYGLISGTILRIINIEYSYGVNVARVQRTHGRDRKIFAIVLPSEMMEHLNSDAKVEAFFDETCEPYTITDENGKSMEVYIKPYKLLLL